MERRGAEKKKEAAVGRASHHGVLIELVAKETSQAAKQARMMATMIEVIK